MLFSACLQIHVVCVEILRDTVGIVATQPTFQNCKVRTTNTTTDPKFYTMAPNSAKDVIFLWNHSRMDPYRARDPLQTPADHYTLLEMLEPQPTIIPENALLFKHVQQVKCDFEDSKKSIKRTISVDNSTISYKKKGRKCTPTNLKRKNQQQ
jgi:hypothetical protein